MSYLFEKLGVPHQDVLTHQFMDQRVATSAQLSQEAHAETLQPQIRETVNFKIHASGIKGNSKSKKPVRKRKVALNQKYCYVSLSVMLNRKKIFFWMSVNWPFSQIIFSRHLPRRVSAVHWCRGLLLHTSVPCTEYAGCSGVCGPSHPPDVIGPPFVLPGKNCT